MADTLPPLPKGAVLVEGLPPLPKGAVMQPESAYDRFINAIEIPKMEGNAVVGPMAVAGAGELIKGAGAATELAFPETGRNISRLGERLTGQVKEQYPVAGTAGQIGSYLAPYSAAQKLATGLKSIPQLAGDLGLKAIPQAASVIGKIPSFATAVAEQSAIGAGTGALLTPSSEGRGNAAIFGAATGPVGEIIAPAAKFTGKALSETLGLTTGAGSKSIEEAAKAGVTGNQQFIQNLRGEVPMTDVLEAAQSGMQALKTQRKQAYEQGIATTKPNQEIVAGKPLPKPAPRLNFAPIENSFKQSLDNLKVQGGGDVASAVGEDSLKDINKIKTVVNEWKSKSGLHTAEGLDILKRRIDDLYRNDMTNEAKAVLSQTRNSVKQTIVKQDKNYAKTMKDYEKSLGIERELEKALSLGDRTSADTAIRKLQSLTRNNVNANYGYRKELADILRTQGGVDLMPALAGQSLNTWIPRGMHRIVPELTAGSAIGGVALAGPAGLAPLATLPLQSPRLVGEATYKAGQMSRPVLDLANSGTPEQRKLAKLLTMRAAQQGATNE
jgi:hypothetical protein